MQMSGTSCFSRCAAVGKRIKSGGQGNDEADSWAEFMGPLPMQMLNASFHADVFMPACKNSPNSCLRSLSHPVTCTS
jgi:hypothetical protein